MQRRRMAFVMSLVLLLLTAGAMYAISIDPGGMWESPSSGTQITGVVRFEARAYPKRRIDPGIDYVQFTVTWEGREYGPWMVACKVDTPIEVDLYTCDWDPTQQGEKVPEGDLRVSFDVFDTWGNYNKAPHGVRTITWKPIPHIAEAPPEPVVCLKYRGEDDKKDGTFIEPEKTEETKTWLAWNCGNEAWSGEYGYTLKRVGQSDFGPDSVPFCKEGADPVADKCLPIVPVNAEVNIALTFDFSEIDRSLASRGHCIEVADRRCKRAEYRIAKGGQDYPDSVWAEWIFREK